MNLPVLQTKHNTLWNKISGPVIIKIISEYHDSIILPEINYMDGDLTSFAKDIRINIKPVPIGKRILSCEENACWLSFDKSKQNLLTQLWNPKQY